jgi:hypothetical protein
MKKIFFVLYVLTLTSTARSQDTTGVIVQQIVQINDAIEKAFLDKNVAALDTLFGNDLLFYHGGGNVDNKKSYIARVPKSNYASRTTDSTRVEIHDNAALVTGRVIVYNSGEKPKPPYGIHYVRLYLLRNIRWVLVSHRTIQKWDEQKK